MSKLRNFVIALKARETETKDPLFVSRINEQEIINQLKFVNKVFCSAGVANDNLFLLPETRFYTVVHTAKRIAWSILFKEASEMNGSITRIQNILCDTLI